MPGLGGLGALARLHVLQPTLPILITTGKVDRNVFKIIEEDQYCTLLLTKPCSIYGLKEHIRPLERV